MKPIKPILVLYATREGQTQRIAERIADHLRQKRQPAQVMDVAQLTLPLDLREYRAAVLAASVHAGKHEPEMVSFVKGHRRQLERLPTAFVSVSLAEAGAEDARRTRGQREQASEQVEQMIGRFFEETGWHPANVKPVAGALPYTQYGMLKRFIMKLIVKHQGGSTDTSKDHEYTDWAALQLFIDEFMTAAVELASAGPADPRAP